MQKAGEGTPFYDDFSLCRGRIQSDNTPGAIQRDANVLTLRDGTRTRWKKSRAQFAVTEILKFMEMNIVVPEHNTTLTDEWLTHPYLGTITERDSNFQTALKIYRTKLSKLNLISLRSFISKGEKITSFPTTTSSDVSKLAETNDRPVLATDISVFINKTCFTDSEKLTVLKHTWEPDCNFSFPISGATEGQGHNRRFCLQWLAKYKCLHILKLKMQHIVKYVCCLRLKK
jgi:hypothetical protein